MGFYTAGDWGGMGLLVALGKCLFILFKGLAIFLGLWIAYWFGWFMAGALLFILMKGKAPVLSFGMCFWFGFFTATIHCIILLLI